MRSPTSKSLKLLKDDGYTTYIVEHYNAFSKTRHDLYGFIDIVGMRTSEVGLLGIQTTTGTNLSARIKKAEGLDNYWLWLACGNDVAFHGWRKILKKRGGKQKIWMPLIRHVSMRGILS